MTPPAHGTAPAVLPLFGASAPDKPSAIFDAAQALLRFLEKGRALDARTLRGVMGDAFGASDADGAWTWKDAYKASEAAQVLFLRKFYGPMARQTHGQRLYRGIQQPASPGMPECLMVPVHGRRTSAH